MSFRPFDPASGGVDPADFLSKAIYDTNDDGNVDSSETTRDRLILLENVNAGQLVYLATDPLVAGVAAGGVADKDIVAKRPAVGVATTSGTTGQTIKILQNGLFTIDTTSFAVSEVVSLGNAGAIEFEPQQFDQQIGVVRTSSVTGSVLFQQGSYGKTHISANTKDGQLLQFDATTNELKASSLTESTDRVIATKKMKFNDGMETTSGSLGLGPDGLSIGSSSNSVVIRDKQGRVFSLAQNELKPDGTGLTTIHKHTSDQAINTRQGDSTETQVISSVSWIDKIVGDDATDQVTFRFSTVSTGLRLVVRENDEFGDIILITAEDENWEEGEGFATLASGDTVIDLVSSIPTLDGDVVYVTLEVFAGTFGSKGDTLVFNDEPSAFVPYYTIRQQDERIITLAECGGFSRTLTGDVAITPGTTTVNGTGTAFVSELILGESVKIRDVQGVVDTITSNTVFDLVDAHAAGAGPGVGGGLNAIVFAEDTILDIRTAADVSRLRIDRDGHMQHTGDKFESTAETILFKANFITSNADHTSPTAETVGSVHVFAGEVAFGDTVTNQAFTPGTVASTGPRVITDGSGTFAPNDIVLFRNTRLNNGLFEVEDHLGTLLLLRGVGINPLTDDFLQDQFEKETTSATINKVNVSVWRTSLVGGPEHGKGSETPLTFNLLAHAADVPIIATEEFANSDVRFFSELGLPATQGATDTEVNNGTITIFSDNVFGTQKDVTRYDVPATGDTAKSEFPLTATDWTNILTFGMSYSGICRITKDVDTQSIFSGAGFSSANDPRPSSIESRVGVFIRVDATHTIIQLDGQSSVVLDGTGGKPLVLKDEWFEWEIFVDPTPDAGTNFGAAEMFVNGVSVVIGGIIASNNAVSDEVSVANSSSTGSTTFYFDNFGATIYEEDSVKTLLVDTMAADIAQIFLPVGRRDYTVILPDGNPRKLGNRLDFVLQNISGKLKLKTENTAAPQSLFNGLNEVEKDVSKVDSISLTNTIEGGNVYSGQFVDIIIYDHSGLIASGEGSGPKGMSIVNATTFRVEAIKAVIVDRSLNTTFPAQTFIDLPQTDHVITGGGDQVVNTYINAQGVFEFRAAEPTALSVTGEIFIGKAVMSAGVITVAVFTPNVAYTGSVDGQAELINGGGHKTSGSILSAAGANLTIGVTAGTHHQIGRGFLEDPNSPNLCDTIAAAIIAFTGTAGNLFLVHADAGGAFIIDSFISNSANPDIDPAQFNDGGTLATVPTNRFSAQRVFQSCGTNDIIIYYGTTTYANAADAEAGFEDETPELLTTRDVSYICTILIKENVTNLTTGVSGGDVIFKNRSGDREL